MAAEIRKYELPYAGGDVLMPYAARLLLVGVGGESVVVWAEVDMTRPLCRHRLVVLWMGENPPAGARFMGTVYRTDSVIGSRVGHVFDGGEHPRLSSKTVG